MRCYRPWLLVHGPDRSYCPTTLDRDGFQGCAWSEGAVDSTTRKCWLVPSGEPTGSVISDLRLAFSSSTTDYPSFCRVSNDQLTLSTGKCPDDQVDAFVRVRVLLPAKAELAGVDDYQTKLRPGCMCNNTWMSTMNGNTSGDSWCFTHFGSTRVSCLDPPFNNQMNNAQESLVDLYGASYSSASPQPPSIHRAKFVAGFALGHQMQQPLLEPVDGTVTSVLTVLVALLAMGMALVAMTKEKPIRSACNMSDQLSVDEYVALMEDMES